MRPRELAWAAAIASRPNESDWRRRLPDEWDRQRAKVDGWPFEASSNCSNSPGRSDAERLAVKFVVVDIAIKEKCLAHTASRPMPTTR